MKLRYALPLIAAVLLTTGCQKRAKPSNTSKQVTRSQELFITTDIQKIQLAKGIHFENIIHLNNTDETNVNLRLVNRGGKALNITDVAIEDPSKMFRLNASKCKGKSLQAQESCMVNVAFLGRQKNNYIAIVKINSNDRRVKEAYVKVVGTSINKYSGKLTLEDIPKPKIEKTKTVTMNAYENIKYITLSNNGKFPLTLTSPKLSGPEKRSFSFESTCKDKLAVNKSCQVTIKYNKNIHDGYSLAQLRFPSNGTISPSNKVRLLAYSKPYNLTITNFTVSKNVHEFMDDYFAATQTYYYRTIYQNDVDFALESNIDDSIKNFFASNGYRLAANPSSANKIITLYPTVETEKDETTNDIKFNITLNGYLATKADTKGILKTSDNEVAREHNTTIMRFSSISSRDTFYDKEQFAFGLQIDVDNVTDEYDVYKTVSNTFVSKLFNVIGMPNSTGKE